jgi:broad specificity phosphatase PhoE
MPHPTPRVFIIRHGETEWSLNGRHTGTSDIPLTANGEKRILATGRALVGPDRLIVRQNIAAVYVSPRTRARRTLGMLLKAGGVTDVEVPGFDEEGKGGGEKSLKAQVTEDIREWDYGRYEGITSKEIKEMRKESGEKEWEIWRDGCPGGEYVLSFFSLAPLPRPSSVVLA